MAVGLELYVARPGRVAFDLVRSRGLIALALAACSVWRDPRGWSAAAVVIGTQQDA